MIVRVLLCGRWCSWIRSWRSIIRGVQDEYKVGFNHKLYRSLYLVFDGPRRTDTGKNKDELHDGYISSSAQKDKINLTVRRVRVSRTWEMIGAAELKSS
jgi:hypothetical protein